MSCKTCKYARYAKAENKIACGLISGVKNGLISNISCPHCGEAILAPDYEEFLDTVVFEKDETYLGWGALNCSPNGKPTILTSELIILDENNSCNYYQPEK